MSKRLVMLFCVLVALGCAVPAFAAVQNIKVSGDILARFIARNDFDLSKDSAGSDDKIHVFNSVVRLRVDADLTDNVSTVVRLINERNWNEADFTNNKEISSIDNTNDTNIQLDLAYVTLKEFLYSPLTLTIGRQELHFGNDMIIGDGVGNPKAGIVSGGIGTNQTTNYREATGLQGINGDLSLRKSFDAIRATLNYDPVVIDLVYAKLRSNTVINGTTNDDMDLYGMNVGYKVGDPWNTFAEAYMWSKRNKGSFATPSSGGPGNQFISGWRKDKGDDVQTVGVRANMTPMKKLNVQQEFAYQFGERVSPFFSDKRDRSAFAAQTMVMVTPGWKRNPTLGLIYSYFSGDPRDNDSQGTTTKKYHAWDPMFENQTFGSIINALFPQTNQHNIDFRAAMTPMEDITVQADYIFQFLARGSAFAGAGTAMNEYDGSDAIRNGNEYKRGKKFLGQEFDVNLLYDYTEDVQFGLLLGWFWPGTAFTKVTSDVDPIQQRVTANEIIVSCNVKF